MDTMSEVFRIKTKKNLFRRMIDSIKCKINVLCCCKSKCVINENNISVISNNGNN